MTENSDGLNGTCDDGLTGAVELEIEANVDAAQLQEAAAQRATRQPDRRLLGKEFSAPDQNLPRAPVDDGDFVAAIQRLHNDFSEVLHGLYLYAVIPDMGCPSVQNRSRRVSRRLVHASFLSQTHAPENEKDSDPQMFLACGHA